MSDLEEDGLGRVMSAEMLLRLTGFEEWRRMETVTTQSCVCANRKEKSPG